MDLKKMIYKVNIIDNDRIIVYMHDFNPIKNKSPFTGGKKTTKYDDFMKRKHYQRTVKRWCAKLFEYRIDSDKCRFITLTLDKNMAWTDLLNAFDNFLKSLYRQFGKIEYIRGIEVQNQSRYFHIHTVLIFKDTPPIITIDWLENYWKHGECHIDSKINVYDIWGLIEYLTLFKAGSCQKQCFNATYFPKAARFISTSYNIPKADIYDIEIDAEEYSDLICYCESNGKFIREDGHCYPAPTDGIEYCADRRYMHGIKDYLINNFGTKEVNIKLKNSKED